ncbi:uncharacterized protein LOC117306346 [Asterias rubens]|uniref:uncharacterized protein LOC117306346 n=1 Tax=Asterias rubens TaxID=7604 RepID=UPI0014551243|nr:uncharacterized protein LOC117306346 [Asterias rubens]
MNNSQISSRSVSPCRSSTSISSDVSELSPSTSKPTESAKQVVFDAKKILDGHPKGHAILEEYNKNGYISPGSRMCLVSVLVADLVGKCGKEEMYIFGLFQNQSPTERSAFGIDQDFQSTHSDASNCLLRRWVGHAHALLAYGSNCKSEGVRMIIQDYNAQIKESSDELTALYGFLVLLRLLPSYNTKKKGRTSCQDVEDLLVKFHEVGTSAADALKDGATKQPTLLAFGSKTSIEQIILKIEDYGFTLPSSNIVPAVDTLFKSHYVFNLEYSAQLENFFVYLQSELYGLKFKGKMSTRITEITIAIKAQ